MIKIALVGGPGAGKTTLANAFTAFMKDKGFKFYNVPEYAREFIDKYGINAPSECGPLIQARFLEKQLAREQHIPGEVNGFITDSPAFLAWAYSCVASKEPWLPYYLACKDTYKGFLTTVRNYDFIFVLSRDKAYVSDGTRIQSENEAMELDDFFKALLGIHNVPFKILSGTTETRCESIFNYIKDKIRNA